MIGAAQTGHPAAVRLTKFGAAMGAAVHQYPHFAVITAHEDHRLAADHRGAEIAGFGNFTCVAEIDPAEVEDPVHLHIEQRRILVDAAVHPVCEDQRGHVSHGAILTGMAAIAWAITL